MTESFQSVYSIRKMCLNSEIESDNEGKSNPIIMAGIETNYSARNGQLQAKRSLMD